jgi:hypothetical protein
MEKPLSFRVMLLFLGMVIISDLMPNATVLVVLVPCILYRVVGAWQKLGSKSKRGWQAPED